MVGSAPRTKQMPRRVVKDSVDQTRTNNSNLADRRETARMAPVLLDVGMFITSATRPIRPVQLWTQNGRYPEYAAITSGTTPQSAPLYWYHSVKRYDRVDVTLPSFS